MKKGNSVEDTDKEWEKSSVEEDVIGGREKKILIRIEWRRGGRGDERRGDN